MAAAGSSGREPSIGAGWASGASNRAPGTPSDGGANAAVQPWTAIGCGAASCFRSRPHHRVRSRQRVADQHPAGGQVRRAASPVAAAASPAEAVPVSDAASERPPGAAVAPVPMAAATESGEAISANRTGRRRQPAPRRARGRGRRARRWICAGLGMGRCGDDANRSTWGPSSQSTRRPRPSEPVAAASESVQPAPAPVEPVPPSVERVAVPTVAPPPTSVNVEPRVACRGSRASISRPLPHLRRQQGVVSPARANAQRPAGALRSPCRVAGRSGGLTGRGRARLRRGVPGMRPPSAPAVAPRSHWRAVTESPEAPIP